MPPRLCTPVLLMLCISMASAESPLPGAKPIPRVQAIPLPGHQVSIQHDGRELTRYHHDPANPRPFWQPIIGPSGATHTRMGHPHDPHGHSHHNSVWISHMDVNGVDYWLDRGGDGKGRIVHERIERLEDGDDSAAVLAVNRWIDPTGKAVLIERRRSAFIPLNDSGEWLMIVDLRYEPAGPEAVTFNQTPFGVIGVRMAKSIGVRDGGGRILNSDDLVNEKAVFRKPARWVDYSGRVTPGDFGGITLLDHPANPGHPTPFHVRDDGWMGACLTLNAPSVIEPGQTLRLRYGLWVHAGVPGREAIEKVWQDFAQRPLADLAPTKK